jgi:purine-binding chemotaxis protein CheW
MSNLVTTVKSAVATAPAEENQQYLTFMLGGEMFAIGILGIKEIIEYGHLTSVPLMPAHIRGVINLRGAVVPVIDLSARFGRDGTQVTRRTCIVILEVLAGEGKQDIGVVVDAVNEVVEIPADQIEPAPDFGARIRTDFIQGMGKVNERFVIILNVHNVLSVEEMALLSQATQGQLAPPTA